MNLSVDLSIFGSRQAGVALYAVSMARFLEEKYSAKVICPLNWSHHFFSPSICYDPIKFKNSIICRNFSWSKSLTPKTFLYCPHDRFALGVKNQVVTIHDLIPYQYPPRNPIDWIYYHMVLPLIIRRFTAVFTVSNTSKNDIIKSFKIDASKIHVVPNGIDLKVWSKGHDPDRDEPYLLCVSANRPYKNTLELIDNYPIWAHKYKLKILGSRARYGLDIRARVAQYGLEGRVEFWDDLSNEEVICLYRRATALIYPSLAEGFGRPPLEAMAIGCPVLLSNIPVHLENFNEAGIFIEPNSIKSWEHGFQQISDSSFISNIQKAGYFISERFQLRNTTKILDEALLKVLPNGN